MRNTLTAQVENFGWYPWLLFGHGGRKEFQDLEVSKAPKTSKPLFDSGFFVLQDEKKGDYLIFDAGKPCPDYLPAHAHADLLSYELMVDSQRVVVDSGVYEYAAGQWRDYFRSTRAHNTVEIAAKDQSEVWGGFRAARRARPGLNNYTDSKERTVIDIRHDGYQRLGIPVMHRRIFWWEKGLFWFVLDEICGRGRIDTKNFVHIHPSLGVNLTEHGGFQIRKESRTVLGLQSLGNDTQKIITGREDGDIQGWYSEEFGKKTPNSVICLEKEAELPFCFGYVLYPGEDLVVQYSQTGSRMYRVRVMLSERTIAVDIEPGKVTHRS